MDTPATENPEPAAATGESAPAEAVVPEMERRRRRKLLLLLLLLLAFLLLLAVAVWYLLFRQPFNPIPNVPGKVTLPTYSTSIYGASRPLGVAVLDDGSKIFIGETDGDRIAKAFDGAGALLGLLQPPQSTGTDHVPVYLARDPLTGEIYVSDRTKGTIYIYNTNGDYQREYTAPQSLKGWQPLGLAFDKAGNLYATNLGTSPQSVNEIGRDGQLVRTFGEAEGLSFPNGVAVDNNGNVYVTDSNNGRLLVYSSDGALQAQVGRGASTGNLGLPRGVVITSKDQVLIADSTGQNIVAYGLLKAGEHRLEFFGSFGTEGAGDGQFEYPNGLTVDGRGRVYVVDSGNDRVQVWSY